MSPHRSLVLLALLATTPVALAQTPTDDTVKHLEYQVLVQGAFGDVVLNAPLLQAIVSEQRCLDAVHALGATYGGSDVDMPVAHLPGTFQIRFHTAVGLPATSTPEQRNKVVDTVVAHLAKRLDGVLFTEPREQVAARREELQRRHRELQVRHVELRARVDSANANRDAAKRGLDGSQTQLAAARLELAVEERARDQIEKLRAQFLVTRDECRAVDDKIERRRNDLQNRVSALTATSTAPVSNNDELEKRKAELATIQDAMRDLTASHSRANENVVDAQRMLTAVLEQVPANALAMQRARARVEVLTEQTARAERELTDAEASRKDAAALTADAEQVSIEMSVAKTLLLELEGKLVRLQAPTYTVLGR